MLSGARVGDAFIALGGAFLAAGVLARAGRRLGLPTIPLFMIAGVVFGPHTPGVALVDDVHELELLAALGLVLLLFHLGLEFSLGDLVAGGRRLLGAGAVYLALNMGGGLAFGAALGWGGREALVLAGAIGISSSAIVTKLLIELRRLAHPESRLILGIVVVEDVFLALYLAILEPVLGGADGPAEAIGQFAVAFGFLLGLAAVARWGAGLVGKLVAAPDDELLTVCFVGFAVLLAGLAEELGVSDAIGAFMAGLVLAESTVAERVERLVLPLRDAFAAIFFFAFGLSIDPGDAGRVAGPVAAAVVMTLFLNLSAGVIAARLHGFGRRPAAAIGLTVLGRGEFSLILATLAAGAGLDDRVGPFVALYVLVLALGGPVLAGRSARLSGLLPVRLFPSAPSPSPATSSGRSSA
jgi:monovalent cation:H+ antiporter-2, CPA2 family